MINNGLIIALAQHPIFGWKFSVHSAEWTESGNIRIHGTPSAKSKEYSSAPDEFVELMRLTNDISDKQLMKIYSRKKTLAEFKKELTDETMNLYIRPRIEHVNQKIVEIARQHRLCVYFREKLLEKLLFVQVKTKVIETPTKCLFNFVKDEKGFRYFISLTNEACEISLQTNRAVIISEKPSIVLINSEIHCVENIESKKLAPFFTKEFIEVPQRSEEMYLKSFVLKTMQKYETRIQGIHVFSIHPEKKAVLSLEKDFHHALTLILWFEYDEQYRFFAGNGKMKHFRLEKKEGVMSICQYVRDEEWEKSLVDKLLSMGLIVKTNNHYYTNRQDVPLSLLEWLKDKATILEQDFVLEQNLEVDYFIGDISIEASMEEKIDWFDVSIVVMIADFKIPFSNFRNHILKGNRDFVLPDGKIFVIPEEWYEKYSDMFRLYKEDGPVIRVKKHHTQLLQDALGEWFSQINEKAFNRILDVHAEHHQVPLEINADLRPYQTDGFNWLVHLYKNNLGACLADDMGLGKTLQTITLLQHIYGKKEQKPVAGAVRRWSLFDDDNAFFPASIVVAPTSLLHNWKNEIQRFAPKLNAYVYAGNERMRIKDNIREFDRYQVIISSYGVVRNDIETLRNYRFQLIVLDESQYIKNPESLSYKAVKQLSSDHKIVITGTPVENSLEDLWAQFNFINEGLLGDFSFFKDEFINRIIKEKSQHREALLKKTIGPFMLRRTKEQVTPELPSLTQKTIYCSMTEKHQEAYEKEKNSIRNFILEAREHPDLITNNFFLLSGLMKLRQIANHPFLTNPDYEDDSGKFEQIIMSCESLKASNHKVLIFSSFVKHLRLLAEKFDAEGWKYAILTGETVNRMEEINRFKENDDISCFFISLKAGSTGLNLTEADYVFIIDPWWNPASEMQALSRAHRIGQDKPVFVYRFISSDTIEEKILRLQDTKKKLFEMFVNDTNPLAMLNLVEIEQLL